MSRATAHERMYEMSLWDRKGSARTYQQADQPSLLVQDVDSSYLMNTPNDPTAVLANLIAILSQSTQRPAQQAPPVQLPPQHDPSQNNLAAYTEPVFVQGEILDTSLWIGTNTVPWYEPKLWDLPRQAQGSSSVVPPAAETPVNKQTQGPPPETVSSKIASLPTFSHALKYVAHLSQSEGFMDSIRGLKTRQNHFESDLFEERGRIHRKFDSKRKMGEILHSLGSQYTSAEVHTLGSFANETLLEQERDELKIFDEGVIAKWGELVNEQTREMERLGVPYFSDGSEEENRTKILAFLEDLVPGEVDTT